MDAEQLIGSLIRGVLTGRRKRSRGALGFLTGGRGSLLNAGTLLTAAGVAWGLYETTMQTSTVARGAGSFGQGSAAAPPPAPGTTPPGPASRAPHPSAAHQAEAAPPAQTSGAVPPAVLRVIRLTISAARADGTLTPNEEAAILGQARSVGAEVLVQAELRQPTPLAELLDGVDPAQRDDLYTLAFAIVRADEGVSGAERIYLAQLAHRLGLDPAGAAALEARAVERIQAGFE
jgi:uncharacterized membrane protein YebE (DUF533 family)